MKKLRDRLKQSNSNPTSEGDSPSVTRKRKGKDNLFFGFNVFYRVLRSLMLFGIVLLLFLGSLGVGVGLGYFAALVADREIPTKEEMDADLNDYELISKIVYSGGEEVATIKSDLLRTTISSENISPLLKKAIMATEDENFEKHQGVVPKALIRALISDVTGLGGSSGGSTLTQQLVKQQILTDETTYDRKAAEILLAMRVEKYYSKDEIITTYLNVSPFGRNNKGQNIAGVEEAAKGIFGKSANDLSLPQAAFIAGLPQSPIVYSPYTNEGDLKEDQSQGLERKDYVLFSMFRENQITAEEYEAAKSYDLSQDFLPKGIVEADSTGFLYNYLHNEAIAIIANQLLADDGKDITKVDALTKERYTELASRKLRRNGYTVTSTIDKGIYDKLQEAAATYGYLLDEGTGKTVETGSVLMDNRTGRIYGFIGGRDYLESQYNHAFTAKRSPGSTIKPILIYAPAIDQGMIGSESMISNYATKYSDGAAIVHNYGDYGGSSTGFASVRTALKNSYNTTVFYLRNELYKNVDVIGLYMDKMNMGITKDQFSNESAGVGTADVTVYTETNAFATLANGGVYNQGYSIESITDSSGNVIYQHEQAPVQVFSKATASIMNDLMRDVVNSGTATRVKSQLQALSPTLSNADWVGKTGTSESDKDFWFIGSTPSITFSAWIGYDDSSQMNSSWGANNQVYWAYVANHVYQNYPDIFGVDEKFTLDTSVIKSTVSNATGEKMGDVVIEGATVTVPGTAITSLYAKNGASNTKYRFAIGGTDDNFKSFWTGKITEAKAKAEEEKKKKEEEEKAKEKEKEDDEEKEEPATEE